MIFSNANTVKFQKMQKSVYSKNEETDEKVKTY